MERDVTMSDAELTMSGVVEVAAASGPEAVVDAIQNEVGRSNARGR